MLSVIGTSVWCGSFVEEGLCWPCQKKTPEKGKGRKPSSKAAAAAAGGPGKKVEAVLVTKQNFFLKTVRQPAPPLSEPFPLSWQRVGLRMLDCGMAV